MSRLETVERRLAALRAADGRRRRFQLGGAVLGLGLATLHWSGFLLAGVLVGLAASTPGRGVLAGLGIGVLGWVIWAGWLLTLGSLGTYLGAGQPLAVSLLIAPLLGALGGLIRGVV
jgi:hypothetical protein